MRTIALAVGAIVLAGQATAALEASAPSRRKPHPTIVVEAKGDRGSAPTHLLGANHTFDADGRGLWDPRSDPSAVVRSSDRSQDWRPATPSRAGWPSARTRTCASWTWWAPRRTSWCLS